MGTERIVWDAVGEHIYETGVKNCVLYPQDSDGSYPKGVAWNGITAITEKPTGAEANPIYADDIKYLNLYSIEEFESSVEAYTYPDEFALCDGSAEIAPGVMIGQQDRKSFGLCYKTTVGNDVDNNNYGYKLHMVYGCTVSPSEKAYQTINDNPEAINFSWDMKTIPVNVTGKKATASLTVDSTKLGEGGDAKLKALEDILYGVDAPDFSTSSTYAVGDYVTHEDAVYKCTTAVETPGVWNDDNWTEVENPGPRLPLPDEIASIMA